MNAPSVRRVITGFDESGKAVFLKDDKVAPSQRVGADQAASFSVCC
jgi:hypothetical protein